MISTSTVDVVEDISEIRRRRARELAEREGGLTRFADRLGRSESQVSQIIGTNPVRNIGSRLARDIESAFKKPSGWLDSLPNRVAEEPVTYTADLPKDAVDVARKFSEATPEARAVISWVVNAFDSPDGKHPTLAELLGITKADSRRAAHERKIEDFQRKKQKAKRKPE